MKLTELLTLIALGVSSLNAVLLMLTFIRAGRWKDGEDAQRLIGRVDRAEAAISTLNAKMENVATKADIAGLTEKVVGVEAHSKSIERGVERIEGHLMRAVA